MISIYGIRDNNAFLIVRDDFHQVEVRITELMVDDQIFATFDQTQRWLAFDGEYYDCIRIVVDD